MKRLLTLITSILFTTISYGVYAQHIQEWTSDFVIRYGNYNNETIRICVLVDINGGNYKNAEYALSTRFGSELLPCSIQFHGQDALMQFYSDLKQIRNKYSEWLNIARQNGIKDLVKEIPVKICQNELTYYNGNMNELKTFNAELKGIFRAEFNSLSLFPSNDTVRIGLKVVNGEDLPIFHVRSVKDLDKIIDAVNIEKIKAKLGKKIQTQNLFN